MSEEKTKKGLGRGLMSLFGDQPEEKKVEPVVNSSYLLVSVSELARSKFQPRNFFDEKKN